MDIHLKRGRLQTTLQHDAVIEKGNKNNVGRNAVEFYLRDLHYKPFNLSDEAITFLTDELGYDVNRKRFSNKVVQKAVTPETPVKEDELFEDLEEDEAEAEDQGGATLAKDEHHSTAKKTLRGFTTIEQIDTYMEGETRDSVVTVANAMKAQIQG